MSAEIRSGRSEESAGSDSKQDSCTWQNGPTLGGLLGCVRDGAVIVVAKGWKHFQRKG